MNLLHKYIDLEKQRRLLRRDMKIKREAISREVSVDRVGSFGSTYACVQLMDVLGIGMKNKFTQIEVAHCDVFCENDYCPNKYCHMFRKNHRYINSVQLYESVKQAQWNLIKDALKIKKK